MVFIFSFIILNLHTYILLVNYTTCFECVCVFSFYLTLPMSTLSGAVRRFAGPVGCVGLDIEGVTGGRLQVPDDLLQRHLTDSLLVLHLYGV